MGSCVSQDRKAKQQNRQDTPESQIIRSSQNNQQGQGSQSKVTSKLPLSQMLPVVQEEPQNMTDSQNPQRRTENNLGNKTDRNSAMIDHQNNDHYLQVPGPNHFVSQSRIDQKKKQFHQEPIFLLTGTQNAQSKSASIHSSEAITKSARNFESNPNIQVEAGDLQPISNISESQKEKRDLQIHNLQQKSLVPLGGTQRGGDISRNSLHSKEILNKSEKFYSSGAQVSANQGRVDSKILSSNNPSMLQIKEENLVSIPEEFKMELYEKSSIHPENPDAFKKNEIIGSNQGQDGSQSRRNTIEKTSRVFKDDMNQLKSISSISKSEERRKSVRSSIPSIPEQHDMKGNSMLRDIRISGFQVKAN